MKQPFIPFKNILPATLQILFCLFCFISSCFAENLGTEDSLKKQAKLRLGGGIDTYFAYNFNTSTASDIPYYVSMNRSNEFNINLAYLDLEYQSSKVKFRFIPGIGTYMNANYALEPGLLKIPVEANTGVQLFKKKNIWLEAGVFSSPYTNETPLSKDHLMYSRSLAPEYVPYYITGLKTSMQLAERLKLSLYLINGWQQTKDLNKAKSFGSSLEFKRNENTTFYWNTYIGDERSVFQPNFRIRYFSDVYVTFLKDRKWSLTSCAYMGIQEIKQVDNSSQFEPWWQANLIGRYTFKKGSSISARAEYFSDPNGVQINTGFLPVGFDCFAYSFCYSIPFEEHLLLRFEFKQLHATDNPLFVNDNGALKRTMPLAFMNLTFWL